MTIDQFNTFASTYLPKIFSVGIGPIVPLFIKAYFQDFSPSVKWTLGVIYIVTAWLVYMIEGYVGIFFHFSDLLTIGGFVVFLVCALLIYFKLQNSNSAKIITYLFALICLSLGAANMNYLQKKVLCIFGSGTDEVFVLFEDNHDEKHLLTRSIKGQCLVFDEDVFNQKLIKFKKGSEIKAPSIDKGRAIVTNNFGGGAIYDYTNEQWQ